MYTRHFADSSCSDMPESWAESSVMIEASFWYIIWAPHWPVNSEGMDRIFSKLSSMTYRMFPCPSWLLHGAEEVWLLRSKRLSMPALGGGLSALKEAVACLLSVHYINHTRKLTPQESWYTFIETGYNNRVLQVWLFNTSSLFLHPEQSLPKPVLNVISSLQI